MITSPTIYRVFLLVAHSVIFALLVLTAMQIGSAAFALATGLTLGAYALGAAFAGVSLMSENERLARNCVLASGILLLLLLAPAAFELFSIVRQSE